MPEVRDDHITVVGDGRNLGENRLICETIDDRSGQETRRSGDYIIKLAFSAPATAVPGQKPARAMPTPKIKPPTRLPTM